MAGSGPLSPCTSPSKTARLGLHCPSTTTSPIRLALPSFTSRRQHHSTQQRHHFVSTSALEGPAAACSPSCSNFTQRSTAHVSQLQPGLPINPGLLPQRPIGFGASRFSSCTCRDAPAGGSVGPTNSSGNLSDGFDAEQDPLMQLHSMSRAVSPTSTAAQHAGLGPDTYSSSSNGVSSAGLSSQQQGSGSSAEPQEVPLLNPAAAAAVALPGVSNSPTGSAVTATAAAAAAAEAAVAGALESSTTSHAFAPGEDTPMAPSAGHAAATAATAAELQDMLTLLKMQVASGVPSEQLASTLVPIVRCAAHNQLSLHFVTTADRHMLLLQLMETEDPAVAVLAAEAWCRVCGEADLPPWADTLLPAVPPLLSIISSNTAPEARKVPLLFFAMSSLVRMATVPAVAQAVRQQGGLPLLVSALHVVPAAICQVTTFALFRLMRELDGDLADEQLSTWQQQPAAGGSNGTNGSNGIEQDRETEQQAGQELALLTFVRAGAFGKLCQVLAQVEEGSAHELAFSMLLSFALIPAAQQLVADQGEVQQLVQVMNAPPSRAVRLEAMLVLGRLAARNRACQQDAVREGVVPVLVEMMQDGSDEERCHACRLLAILGQHETTHQIIMDWGAVPVMLQLLEYRGRLPKPKPLLTPDPDVDTFLAQLRLAQPWRKGDVSQSGEEPDSSDDEYADEDDELDGTADGSSTGGTQQQYTSSKYRTSGPFKARKRPQTQPAAAAGATAAGGSEAVGPELVLEQAAGLACMLCHNADNHFNMVNLGIVPMLVQLLNHGTAPKTVTYTLASLLMLCMADSRNAAVVARAGAIPALVSIARESSNKAANRELSAALLAVMSRSQAAQVDVVASGGIPALTRLLAEGTSGAFCSAAEALTQIATTSDVRCRLIVRAGALPHLKPMLQSHSSPINVLWASRLLKALVQERNTLMEICETPGLLDLLPGILTRHLDTQQHLDAAVQEFRAAARAAAAAGDTVSATSGSDGSDDSSINSSSGDKCQASDSQVFGHNHQDGAAAKATEAIGEDANGQQVVEADGGVGSAAEHEALAKAQAHVAWLLAALASDIRTREVMAQLSPAVVRPLVVMLRDSQDLAGPGYSLQDVLQGMSNNKQAAASAALRALGRHVRIAGLIQSEVALQHWMGHNVQLLESEGEWPPPTPGWFLNVDWWRPDGQGGASEV